MKSPALHMLGKVAWVVSALTAINVGLCPLGMNLVHMVTDNLGGLAQPLHYLIGLCGVISLVCFVKACAGKSCSCGHCSSCR